MLNPEQKRMTTGTVVLNAWGLLGKSGGGRFKILCKSLRPHHLPFHRGGPLYTRCRANISRVCTMCTIKIQVKDIVIVP